MSLSSRVLFPMLGLFAFISLLILLLSRFLKKYGVDTNVLLVANGIFLLLTLWYFSFRKKRFHIQIRMYLYEVLWEE
jgi:hypothetical protein